MEERKYQGYKDGYDNIPSEHYLDEGHIEKTFPEDNYYEDAAPRQDYDQYAAYNDISQDQVYGEEEYPYPPSQTYNQAESANEYHQDAPLPPQPREEYYQDAYPQEDYEHTIHYDDVRSHGDAQMNEQYYPRQDSYAHQQYREDMERPRAQRTPHRVPPHKSTEYAHHHEQIETEPKAKKSESKGTQSLNEKLFAAKINNEKFIVLTLLAAVVFTAMIIGIGWSLFSPSTPKEVAVESVEKIEPTSTTLTETSTSTTTAIAEPEATDQLTLVYGNNTAKTTKNTPVAPKPTPAPVRTKPTSSISAPISAQTLKKPSSTYTPPVVKKTPVAPTKWVSLYWIQIFSTTNKDRALQIKKDLSTQGISPTIVTKTINGSVYYRLRIGPYGNKAEGEKFLSWIQKNPEYTGAYISLTRTKQ